MNQRMDFKAKGGAHAMAHLNQDEADEDSQCFYIKTLQIFDKEGNELDDPILVEQVYGNFDSYRLYDISTLHYKDSLYYFKRIYITDGKADDEERAAEPRKTQSPIMKVDKEQKGAQLGSLTPVDGGKRSIGSSLDNYPGRNKAASENQDSADLAVDKQNLSQDDIPDAAAKQKGPGGRSRKKYQKTILQLYCYDLRKGIEKPVERVKIDEFLLPELDQEQDEQENSTKKPLVRSGLGIQEMRQKQDDARLKQYNITFSYQFGPESLSESDKYESENEFLDNQYFCIQ